MLSSRSNKPAIAGDSAICSAGITDSGVCRPAVGVPHFPGVIGTFMGRDALSLATAYLGLRASDGVLLPAFTCQDVLKRFVRINRVSFYDVGPTLAIDPDEVRARLGGHTVRLMLMTNYFGFLQPFRDELKQLCAEKGVCLIEDCAHSLLTEGSAQTGEFAIYSFRKLLLVPDGGGLKVNRRCDSFPLDYYPRIWSNVLSFLATTKSALHLHGAALSRDRLTSRGARAGILGKPARLKRDRRVLPLSSRSLKRLADQPIAEIVRRRREDFQFWRETVGRTPWILPVFGDLPPTVCPMGFPVRVKNRGDLESRSRQAGIRLQVHWRLEPDVAPECRASHELSRVILTLPLYPDIERSDREALARIVTA